MEFNNDNEIIFSYFDNGTNATNYNNARVIMNYIQPLLSYFENNTFKADWLSPDIVGFSKMMKYGKLYVADDDTNYIYGQAVLR